MPTTDTTPTTTDHTHRLRTRRPVLAGALLAVAAAVPLGSALVSSPAAAASPPTFQMPFKCDTSWTATTYDRAEQVANGRVTSSWSHVNLVDLGGGKANSVVLASAAGFARLTDAREGKVTIDHGNGWTTIYQHMTNITVNASGRQVTQGEQIGVIGAGRVGTSSGPHLHYGQLLNGTAQSPKFATGTFTWSAGKTASSGNYRFYNDRSSTNSVRSGNGCATTTPAPPPAAPSLSSYANKIVKWSGDPNTSWLVTPDLKRLWIPDGGTYNELRARGFAGPIVLDAATLNRLPDQSNRWAASGATWTGNRTLRRGMSVTSTDGRYRFVMQNDGNLVLYGPSGRALWATSWVTSRSGSQEYVVFQSDGNLVTYGGGRPIWATNTAGRGATRFVIQNDGNMVIYAGSRVLWASNTAGRT